MSSLETSIHICIPYAPIVLRTHFTALMMKLHPKVLWKFEGATAKNCIFRRISHYVSKMSIIFMT